VVFQNLILDFAERRLDRPYLVKNVNTITVLVQHARNTTYLSLYAREPGKQFGI